jgi:hypothetical protein
VGPLVCPETSVSDYRSPLHKIAEEQRFDLHRSGSLKPQIAFVLAGYSSAVRQESKCVHQGLRMSESTVYGVSIFLSTWRIGKVFYVKFVDLMSYIFYVL